MKPLCRSSFSFKKALNSYNMWRFMTVLLILLWFDPKWLVFCCLCWFEVTETEILGTSGKFKILPLVCVKPRKRNSAVHRSQILSRIWFYQSGRRNLPQFRGLQRFDEVDRSIFRCFIFTENIASLRGSRDSCLQWHFNSTFQLNETMN